MHAGGRDGVHRRAVYTLGRSIRVDLERNCAGTLDLTDRRAVSLKPSTWLTTLVAIRNASLRARSRCRWNTKTSVATNDSLGSFRK